MTIKSIKIIIFFLVLSAFYGSMIAQEPYNVESPNNDWLKIYYNSKGIERLNAHPVTSIDSISFSVSVEADDSESVIRRLNIFARGEDVFTLTVDSISSMVLGGNISSLYIDTDPYVDEISSKTEYLTAQLRYVPYGDGTDSLIQDVSIKGRGNTSWYFPKKPYRLKFDKKQSLGGLKKAKSFVLLSNYIDNTLMRNAVALKVAELVGLPYTNKIIPVNLIFNNQPRGNYMITHKVGINSGSVDIDENEGVLWELDANFDEEFRFKSSTFGLPCMIKDPDFHEITGDSLEELEEIWNFWKSDLENAFQLVDEGKWYEAFDAEQAVKYLLVQNIVLNGEIAHPKSVYLYKKNKEDKYSLGPVWDFDWAFNYSYLVQYPIMNSMTPAFPFWSKFFKDSYFLELFKHELVDFCNDKLDLLLNYIDEYAALIRDSALADALVWPAEHFNTASEHKERNTDHFDENVAELKDWILRRIELIQNDKNYKLYE